MLKFIYFAQYISNFANCQAFKKAFYQNHIAFKIKLLHRKQQLKSLFSSPGSNEKKVKKNAKISQT